jgi:hypothetical protein
MMGNSTIKDFGRSSARFGNISHFYVFQIRFWFGENQLSPEDVGSWLRDNATGYYRVMSYTHKDSVRMKGHPKEFESKVVYVDKVYLASEEDAAKIRLAFDVRDTQVKRPRLKALRKKRKTYKSDPAA